MVTDTGNSRSSGKSEFADGFRRGIPVMLASAPFGLLFGALSAQNGFTISEAVLMSATIFAGASQMVGLELFGQKIAPWLIVFSIFAVNFRHVLYSASVGRHARHWTPFQRAFGFFFMTDPQYAEAEQQVERGNKIAFLWFMGMATPIYICWVAEAAIGHAFGNLIPDPHALALDFLLPIYFLGLVMGFRKRPLWLPVVGLSAVVSTIAFYLVGSPWHVSIGALAGISLAAVMTPSTAESRP